MFGTTAHEMAAKVDSGPIVGAEWFQISDELRFTDLEIKAFDALVLQAAEDTAVVSRESFLKTWGVIQESP